MKYRALEIIIHVAFWLCTSWVLLSGFSVVMHDVQIVNGIRTVNTVRSRELIYQILASVFLGVVFFYLTSWILIHHKGGLRKAGLQIACIIGLGLLLSYLMARYSYQVLAPSLPKTILAGIIIFYITAGIAYGIGKLLHKKNSIQQQILLDKKQTEITLLRKQLQPHFLFNALNNLLSMVNIQEQPKLADSFHKLSQLLRYVIEEIRPDKVRLDTEITFLENYIALQKLRFQDQEIEVNFVISGAYLDQSIEPGLFIIFVENAFKYGTEPERLSQIDIHFDVSQSDRIRFGIRNPIRMPGHQGNKTGLESARRRLNLIYPDKHQLEISQDDDYFVSLTIETV